MFFFSLLIRFFDYIFHKEKKYVISTLMRRIINGSITNSIYKFCQQLSPETENILCTNQRRGGFLER